MVDLGLGAPMPNFNFPGQFLFSGVLEKRQFPSGDTGGIVAPHQGLKTGAGASESP